MCYSADGLRGSIDKTERLYREFVSKVVEESTERNTLTGKGGVKNTARKVAIYVMKRYAKLGIREIGTLFGCIYYSAVSKSSARLEKEDGRR